jgi:hypothetical protein
MSKVYQDGDQLTWKHPVSGILLNGVMRGYSTLKQAVIGRVLIIEVEDKYSLNGGMFNHLVIFESWVVD